MSEFYLETERILLRQMQPSEAPELFDLDSDPEVMKYLSGGKPSTMETCEKALNGILAYYQRYDNKYGLWFAIEKNSQEVMGWFLLRPDKKNLDDTKNPELGYRLKRKFWGRGYATEGSVGLVDKAFQEFNCDSVFAITMLANNASQNVMKKIGMTFLSDYQEDQCVGPSGDRSAVHYAIKKQEWQSQRGSR